MTQMAQYTVWLDEEAYEAGTVKLEDLPGFVEADYKGTESYE